MGRDIRPESDAVPDTYVQRLAKLIPVEITGAYVAITSLLSPLHSAGDIPLLGAAAFLTLLIPFYMKFVLNMQNNMQVAISALSFPIWAANISNIPLSEELFRHNLPLSPIVFGVILILWTVATPIFVR